MNRIRRYFEKMPFGRKSSRVAYATSAGRLPEAREAAEWSADPDFHAGDALLADPGLKAVYKMALEKGCALVTTTPGGTKT